MRCGGNSNPELRMALRTRSRLSRTLGSGSPTIVKDGQAEGDVHLHVDRERLDAEDGGAAKAREHALSAASRAGRCAGSAEIGAASTAARRPRARLQMRLPRSGRIAACRERGRQELPLARLVYGRGRRSAFGAKMVRRAPGIRASPFRPFHAFSDATWCGRAGRHRRQRVAPLDLVGHLDRAGGTCLAPSAPRPRGAAAARAWPPRAGAGAVGPSGQQHAPDRPG